MKKKNKDQTTVKKIEFDANTNEPIVVEISEQEYLEQRAKTHSLSEKNDFVKMKSQKGTRSKMAVERALGIKNEENISNRQRTLKTIVTIAFIVVVVGILAYTAYTDFFASGKRFPSIQELLAIFAQGWPFLICGILCLFLHYLCKGSKLSIMCKALTGKAHFRTCVETGVIGIYYNNITPLAVGGQPFEIYHLSKHGVHGGVAASLPIATFFLNQFAFVILGIISLVMFNANTLGTPAHITGVFPAVFQVLATIGLVCCIAMPSVVVLFSILPKVGAKLVHVVMKLGGKLRIVKNPKETTAKTIKTVVHNSHCIKKIATNPLVFFSTFFISFIENLASTSIAYFCLKAFGYHNPDVSPIIEWLQVVTICFILYASITFIPTPGNSGAADLSFFLLFSAGIQAAGLAFPSMLTWRVLSFYSTLIIGFFFATIKKKADAKRLAAEAMLAPLEVMANDAEKSE